MGEPVCVIQAGDLTVDPRWEPSRISDPGDRQRSGRPASHPQVKAAAARLTLECGRLASAFASGACPAEGRGALPPSRAAPPKTAASCLRESGGKPSALQSGWSGHRDECFPVVSLALNHRLIWPGRPPAGQRFWLFTGCEAATDGKSRPCILPHPPGTLLAKRLLVCPS